MQLLTDVEFDQLLQTSNQPILIFINGESNILPMQHMRESLKQLESSYDLAMYEMHFVNSEDFRLRYQIRYSPSLVLFQDGMLSEVASGFYDRQHIRTWLNDNL